MFDLTAVFMLDALPDMTPKELLSLPGMKQETMELLSVTIIIINRFPKRSETFRESDLFHKYLTELNSVCHVQNSKMKKVISSGTKRNVGLLDKAALLSDPLVTQLCKHKLIYKVS